MPVQNELRSSSPITLIYLFSTGIVTILSNYKEYDLLNYMKLDYNKIFNHYEFWRLITTFLYIGKPNPQLIFNYYLYYKRMKSTEKRFTKNKKLAEFIMMLIYLMILTHISNFIGYIIFKFKPNSFLANKLMFALILINSKRNPDKFFKFYFVRIPNKFVPYFLFSIRTLKTRKYLKNIINFFPGLAYYYLKDVIPTININYDILVTPKFLEDFSKKYFYKKNKIKKNKKIDKENEKNSEKIKKEIKDKNNNNNKDEKFKSE